MKTNSVISLTLLIALSCLTFTCDKPLTILDKVDGVVIAPGKLSLTIGQKSQLTAIVSPSTAKDKSVVWSPKQNTIASVNDDGLVSAIGEGTIEITVSTNDGKKVATCMVTVTKEKSPVAGTDFVTGITFDPFVRIMTIVKGGEAKKLTAIVTPESAIDKGVLWAKGKNGSENNILSDVDGTKVVASYEIDATGRVITMRGVEVGIGTIFAVAKGDPTKIISTRINVIASATVESVAIFPSVKPDLVVGTSFSANAVVLPANALNTKVKWSNSKANDTQFNIYGASDAVIAIYSIDPNNGNTIVITGLAIGTGTITATSEEGSKVSTLQVTVSSSQSVKVTEVQLTPSSTTIVVGDPNTTLTAKVFPSTATNIGVYWSSNDPNVATVDGGVLVAKTAGLTIITATSQVDPSKFATCLVKSLMVYKLIIGESENEDIKGKVRSVVNSGSAPANRFLREMLTPKDYAINAFEVYVYLDNSKSRKGDVFKFNNLGDYTIVKEGRETMYYQRDEIGPVDLYIVEVVDKTTLKITDDQGTELKNKELNVGNKFTFKVEKTPRDVKVAWSSNMKELVTVDENGMIEAKARGSAVITAKANTKTATVTVTVK